MSAAELISYLTWLIYILIFYQVIRNVIRSPRRVNINIALFFALPALVIAIGAAAAVGLITPGRFTNALNSALILALTFVLLRLVDDFAHVPRLLMRGSALLLILLIVSLFVLPEPRPFWLTLLMVLYVVALQVYAALMFVRASRRARGVTRRRLTMAAAGSFFLGLTIFWVAILIFVPSAAGLVGVVGQLSALASGVSYFLGFAPPTLLRRAWQEPELRTFLRRAARLPRLPTTGAIVEEVQKGAAAATGAPHAEVGLWDEESGLLHFVAGNPPFELVPHDETPEGHAFQRQVALFREDLGAERPNNEGRQNPARAQSVLIAPITADEKRLGILRVYSQHSPLFVEEDLALVQLLADQAAVILESRALIDEATRVRAREEALRLKDDFLSAAAHDLRTPLTTLLGQAQVMKLRAERRPDAPADRIGLERIEREARRLATLVNELLDARRVEQGQLLGALEEVDLVELALASCQRFSHHEARCRVVAGSPVTGWYDRLRVTQLLDNLIENALKYSPGDREVFVRIWEEEGEAHLCVEDHGIGIPSSDLPHLFERFFRASNVDDRRFMGMGLGLYICRGIVEAHGGRIWATSEAGKGSTFHVVLPRTSTREGGHPLEIPTNRAVPPAAS